MSFWSEDITASDSISPKQIMEQAGAELGQRTKVLQVVVDVNKLSDRIVLIFRISHILYPMDFNLFEASHRLNQTYPVVIDPPASDIPEFLRRKRRATGISGFLASEAFKEMSERYVENEWVCATPAEFTEKLKKLFALDHVKTRIISLQAPVIEKPQEQAVEDEQVDDRGLEEDTEVSS